MTTPTRPPFDFKEQAKALLKRLAPGAGVAPNPALALAACEAALREAFAQGQGTARAPGSSPVGRPASPAKTAPAPALSPKECPHEWEEAVLDGSTIEAQCAICGILQRDVQAACDHYFVDVAGGQRCVACRKSRKSAR